MNSNSIFFNELNIVDDKELKNIELSLKNKNSLINNRELFDDNLYPLKYIPKPINDRMIPKLWNSVLLFQHPMSLLSNETTDIIINNNNNIDININGINNNIFKFEPNVLLGLGYDSNGFGISSKSRKKQSKHNSDNYLNVKRELLHSHRYSLLLNGESILCKVKDKLRYSTDNTPIINTTHRLNCYIPKIFHEHELFYGGDNTDTIEIISKNPYCGGISVLNGTMFWNPDMTRTEKLINAGHAKPDEFKFYYGKLLWNDILFNNIESRNLYNICLMKNIKDKYNDIIKYIINKYNPEKKKYSLWLKLIQLSQLNQSSFIDIFYIINHYYNECQTISLQHNNKINQQIKCWKNSNQI